MLHIFFFVCVVWSAQIQCLKKWPVSQSDISCDRSSHILRIVQHQYDIIYRQIKMVDGHSLGGLRVRTRSQNSSVTDHGF